jgi:hypothetical protein
MIMINENHENSFLFCCMGLEANNWTNSGQRDLETDVLLWQPHKRTKIVILAALTNCTKFNSVQMLFNFIQMCRLSSFCCDLKPNYSNIMIQKWKIPDNLWRRWIVNKLLRPFLVIFKVFSSDAQNYGHFQVMCTLIIIII